MLDRRQRLMPLIEVRKLLVIGDKQLSRSTLRNWVRRGVSGVRLEAIRIGNPLYTSVEAVDRFLAGINKEGSGMSICRCNAEGEDLDELPRFQYGISENID